MRRILSMVSMWLCFLSCFAVASMASKTAAMGNSDVAATEPGAQLISYFYNRFLKPIADIVTGAQDADIARIDNLEEVAIAVMGPTGSGKTTFINMASNSKLRTGRGLESCTSDIQMAQPFVINGRRVLLIDTPGFDDSHNSDTEILNMIALFLATYYEEGKKLAGVIYTHRISDFKMSGISTRNFKMFRLLCGDSTLKNVVIATNMWSQVSRGLGIEREQELASSDLFFKPVLDNGGQMLRHSNTRASAHAIISRIIENQPLPLQIQRELVDQNMGLENTGAGEELNKDLKAQHRKHMKELEALQGEMEAAIRDKDEETKRELEIATRKLEKEMLRVENDSRNLASKYSKEKQEMEERMQKLSDQARLDAEKKHSEYNQQMENLRAQLESAHARDRDDLLRQISRANDIVFRY